MGLVDLPEKQFSLGISYRFGYKQQFYKVIQNNDNWSKVVRVCSLYVENTSNKRLLEKILEEEDLNRRDEIQRVKKDIEKAETRKFNHQDLNLD